MLNIYKHSIKNQYKCISIKYYQKINALIKNYCNKYNKNFPENSSSQNCIYY